MILAASANSKPKPLVDFVPLERRRRQADLRRPSIESAESRRAGARPISGCGQFAAEVESGRHWPIECKDKTPVRARRRIDRIDGIDVAEFLRSSSEFVVPPTHSKLVGLSLSCKRTSSRFHSWAVERGSRHIKGEAQLGSEVVQKRERSQLDRLARRRAIRLAAGPLCASQQKCATHQSESSGRF